VLTTNQKGAIAETAVAHEAVKLGIGVLKPLGDMRYDLVLDTGHDLLRVQCKWATRYGDVIVGRLYGNRRPREGLRRTLMKHPRSTLSHCTAPSSTAATSFRSTSRTGGTIYTPPQPDAEQSGKWHQVGLRFRVRG
jgi:hypothetical protein